MSRKYLSGYSLDYTVGLFIVRDDKVLLIDHKGLGTWLCIGGHIEPNEDPIEALLREAKEETGLEDIAIQGYVNSQFDSKDRKALIPPKWLDKHYISSGEDYRHEHVALYYIAYSKQGDPKLEDAHNGIQWFSVEELNKLERIPEIIRYYAIASIKGS